MHASAAPSSQVIGIPAALPSATTCLIDGYVARLQGESQVALLPVLHIGAKFLGKLLPAAHGRLGQRKLGRMPARLPHPGQRPARGHAGQVALSRAG